jgi:CheY-like chemotaxis protein
MTEKQKTILIIEDEAVLLELLKEMLEFEGYRIVVARNGLEGVEVYKQFKDEISLVLSDMGLPGIGGWEVLRQLRQINPSVKVILSSGFLDSTVRDDMIRSGALDFIQKPYTPERVLEQIRLSMEG